MTLTDEQLKELRDLVEKLKVRGDFIPMRSGVVLALLDMVEERGQVAKELANAIQRFRNLPMLGKLGRLRETPEYAALCEAWNHYHFETDSWRDQAETIAELRGHTQGGWISVEAVAKIPEEMSGDLWDGHSRCNQVDRHVSDVLDDVARKIRALAAPPETKTAGELRGDLEEK